MIRVPTTSVSVENGITMSTGCPYRVEIRCEAEGYPVAGQACAGVIEIELGSIERDSVITSTRLRFADEVFEGRQRHYGIDVQHFADSLARMHRELEGSARLTDWDGEIVLCLTVIRKLDGRIAIGAQLIPAVFQTEIASQVNFLNPRLFGLYGGIRTSIEGLSTDQSCLPPAIAELQRFLQETGISVRGPMND